MSGSLIIDGSSGTSSNGEVPKDWAELLEALGLADEITSDEYADGVITSDEFDGAGTDTAFSTFAGLGDTTADIQLSDLQQVWKSADLKQQSGLASSIIDATDDFLGASSFVNFSEEDVDTAYASFTAANHDLSAMDPATRALLGEDDEISAAEYAVFLYYLVTKGLEDGDITTTDNIDITSEDGEFAAYQQRVIEGYVPGTDAAAAESISEEGEEVSPTAADLFTAINTLNTNAGIEGVDTSDGLTEAELDTIIADTAFATLTTAQQAAINELKTNFATADTSADNILSEAEIDIAIAPVVETAAENDTTGEETTEEDTTVTDETTTVDPATTETV